MSSSPAQESTVTVTHQGKTITRPLLEASLRIVESRLESYGNALKTEYDAKEAEHKADLTAMDAAAAYNSAKRELVRHETFSNGIISMAQAVRDHAPVEFDPDHESSWRWGLELCHDWLDSGSNAAESTPADLAVEDDHIRLFMDLIHRACSRSSKWPRVALSKDAGQAVREALLAKEEAQSLAASGKDKSPSDQDLGSSVDEVSDSLKDFEWFEDNWKRVKKGDDQTLSLPRIHSICKTLRAALRSLKSEHKQLDASEADTKDEQNKLQVKIRNLRAVRELLRGVETRTIKLWEARIDRDKAHFETNPVNDHSESETESESESVTLGFGSGSNQSGKTSEALDV